MHDFTAKQLSSHFDTMDTTFFKKDILFILMRAIQRYRQTNTYIQTYKSTASL